MENKEELSRMARYTIVNQETCIACGACGDTASDIFEYDDSGLSYVHLDGNTGTCAISAELYDDLDDAADGCPTDSIIVSDEPIVLEESLGEVG